jgi:Na+-transporting methylmalonyl-CoA/oxaloacetate decarboxylase gamma subunit
MTQLIEAVRQSDSVVSKALFLMICGIAFVFAVQVVFYLVIKLWPKKAAE